MRNVRELLYDAVLFNVHLVLVIRLHFYHPFIFRNNVRILLPE